MRRARRRKTVVRYLEQRVNFMSRLERIGAKVTAGMLFVLMLAVWYWLK